MRITRNSAIPSGELFFQLEAIRTRLLKAHREAATWHFFFQHNLWGPLSMFRKPKYIVLLELTRTWTRKPERLRIIPFLSLVSIYVGLFCSSPLFPDPYVAYCISKSKLVWKFDFFFISSDYESVKTVTEILFSYSLQSLNKKSEHNHLLMFLHFYVMGITIQFSNCSLVTVKSSKLRYCRIRWNPPLKWGPVSSY